MFDFFAVSPGWNNTGAIGLNRFDPANMVAVRRGAAWVPSAEVTLEAAVEDLNKPLINGDIYSLTDAGTLKSGAVAVVVGNVVVWDSAVPKWVKTDTSTAVEWEPDDFNDRDELLLNTFAMRDAGTLDRATALATASTAVAADSADAAERSAFRRQPPGSDGKWRTHKRGLRPEQRRSAPRQRLFQWQRPLTRCVQPWYQLSRAAERDEGRRWL